MAEKAFAPHSRQQDERLITRVQKDFSAGMFADVPGTSIPENGVADIKNFKNMGDRLIGRTGSRKWGDYSTYTETADLPSYATGITATSTVSGTTRTITISGYSATEDADYNSYFVHDDGTHERITAVNSTTEIETRTESSASKSSSTAWLRKPVNGLYFHKFLKKIILFIGTDIYVAHDISVSAWDLCTCESYVKPSNSISIFDEINNDVILFNSNGVYKVDIKNHPTDDVFYYKINAEVPSSKLTASAATTGNYGYRYVYGLAKLSGTGQNRTRQSTGVTLKTDSGTNDVDTDYKDYTEYWGSNSISATNNKIVSGFTVPDVAGYDTPEMHWDAYTIWRTCDIGASGVDAINGEGNDKEAYAWVADIPVMKSFNVHTSGSNVYFDGGIISDYDEGSDISIYESGTFNSYTISAVNTSSNYATLASAPASVSGVAAYIGATSGGTFTSSGGVLTLVSGDTFTSGDVRRRLFLSDGTYLHISGVTSGVGYTVETDIISTPTAACWSVGTRRFNDELEDENLRPRLAGYPLYQRFFQPLPLGNMGAVTPGFMFTGTRDENYIYYSMIPDGFEYLTGYYHPYYQLTFVKDGIRAFGDFADKLAVYCINSTSVIPLNVTSPVSIPDIGTEITTLAGISLVDSSVGVLDYGSIASIEISKQILITNEPAIRIFNGTTYSNNLASQRIMKTLKSLQPATSAAYTPFMGYIFWGNDES